MVNPPKQSSIWGGAWSSAPSQYGKQKEREGPKSQMENMMPINTEF